jgi:general secretion pathway protein B
MSILLNALKKSQAQRQVGGPPDIHAPIELTPGQRSSGHRWIIWALIVISAGALGWFGWQQYRPTAAPGDSEAVPVAESPAVPVEASEESGKVSGMNAATEMIGADDRTPVVSNFPAKNREEKEQRKKQLSQTFAEFEAEPEAMAGEGGAAEQESETDPLAEVESTMQSIAREQAGEEESEPQSRQRLSRSDAESDVADQPAESEPISFWQIPQSLRDNLPEFRITVLVYAEKPEDRFVLINGVRLLEQEELVSGVTLDEIRRDGAVFRYRNYRFLVKG